MCTVEFRIANPRQDLMGSFKKIYQEAISVRPNFEAPKAGLKLNDEATDIIQAVSSTRVTNTSSNPPTSLEFTRVIYMQ